MSEVETRTINKVMWRLVPFLIVCYFIAYLDRVNVGFAALSMNKALGLNAEMFGFGSGIFFLAYFVLEVPSNLMLEKFGAKRWIARIMVTWGVLSGAMAAIPALSNATGISNEYMFYTIRTLLGAAEAGFFPGIIFYLTLWFPAYYRGRMIGLFMAAIPISSVLGSPLSGYLLGMDGVAGMAGWQWLYIVEAVPALLLAVMVLTYLPNGPNDSPWLASDERNWLTARLADERAHREAKHDISVLQSLSNPRVLALSLVYFGGVAAIYGVGFFLPTIVKGYGLTNAQTGWVTAIPSLAGAICMVWYSRRSDRVGERKYHTAFALLIGALGLLAATAAGNVTMAVIAFSVSALGVYAMLPVFWTLPTAFLSGSAAAAGIAVVNSIGNLSGFAGPFAVGYIKQHFGSFSGGLWLISGLMLVAMVIVLALGHDHSLEKAPQGSKQAAD